jgi:hypothetical protein
LRPGLSWGTRSAAPDGSRAAEAEPAAQRTGYRSLNSQSVRAAIHIAAIFGIYLSLAMLIPAFVDFYYGNADWQVFALSAFFTGGLCLAIALATQGPSFMPSARFAFLVVNLLWATTVAVGAIPLVASSIELTVADAVFESTSALTTTGSTVIVGLDSMPPGILLWRSLLNWIGGLGVIVLGLLILPFLNIGGVSYFKLESSDIEDRPFGGTAVDLPPEHPGHLLRADLRLRAVLCRGRHVRIRRHQPRHGDAGDRRPLDP